MKEIKSPVFMSGVSRTYTFKDVLGYKKDITFTGNVSGFSYASVTYVRGSVVYYFNMVGNFVCFSKCDYSKESSSLDVTYDEFEKFCKIGFI